MEPQVSHLKPVAPVAWSWTAFAALAGLAVGVVAGTLAAEVPEEFSTGEVGQWVAAMASLSVFALLAWHDQGRPRMATWLAAPLGFLPLFVMMGI